jgi:ribosome-associated heat shock protein Hsp15
VSSLRLDQWLFQARLYKSRTKATDACRNGRVIRNGTPADASDLVSVGDVIRIRERGIYRQYRVLEIPPKNLSKEDAKKVYSDETPQEIKIREQMQRQDKTIRRQTKSDSKGRPSKKDRRILEKFRRR